MIKEEFEIHDKLNDKIFDVDTTKMVPEVRKKVVEIVSEFEDYLSFPVDIVDIQLVGSNASYNYSDTEAYKSDMDIHIIVNFEELSENGELVKAFLDSKKSSFNDSYDLTIKGIPVELYVQDINAGISSNGIYSICDDKWIKFPKEIKDIKKRNNSKEIEKWKSIIEKVLESNKIEEVQNLINRIYLVRHNSIAVDGEYGFGNQLFKDIRSTGLLDELKDRLKELKSKKLSLEGLCNGKFINRVDIED